MAEENVENDKEDYIIPEIVVKKRKRTLLSRWLPSPLEWLVMFLSVVLLWFTSGALASWLLVITVTTTIPGKIHVCASVVARALFNFIFLGFLSVELVFYVAVRMLIILAEHCVSKHKNIRKALAKSTSYQEWYERAKELDRAEGRDRWQKSPPPERTYDKHNWGVIDELLLDMRIAREMDDPIAALTVLQQSTQRNVGGIMSADLFSHTNTGEPKKIVLDFVKEVETTLTWLVDGVAGTNDTKKTKKPRKNSITSAVSAVSNFSEGISEGEYVERLQDYQKVMLQQMRDWESFNSFEDDDRSIDSQDMSLINKLGTSSVYGSRRPSLRSRLVEQDHSVARRSSIGQSIMNNPAANASHLEQCQHVLRRARASYGRTALCLSGGSSNATSHFGVIKALYEEKMMPPIIAGTSAGSYVAAFVGTRTDEEIKRDLKPELFAEHAKFECVVWHNSWLDKLEKLITTGCPCYLPRQLFDTLEWFCSGDLTFEEAYLKTGRVLNITASPTTKNASPALLNYLSAPNVTVMSAVMCSCNLPGLLPPRPLYIKTEDGFVVPQRGGISGLNYADGSCRMDIPTRSLGELFNCTHFITAQANPYAVPFHFEHKGSVGRPNLWESVDGDDWVEVFRGGFILSSLESFIKGVMYQQLSFLDQVHSKASVRDGESERHESDVLIVARQRVENYLRLLNDPTLDQYHHFIRNGAIATYEAMAMLKLDERIAHALDRSLERLAQAEQKLNEASGRSSMAPRPSFTHWAAASSNMASLLQDYDDDESTNYT